MNPGSILIDLYRVNNFDLVETKKFLYERTLESLNVIGLYENVELYTSFTDAFRTIVNEARVKKPPNRSVYDHFSFIYNHPKWTNEYTFLLLLHLKVIDIELTVVTEDPKQRVKNIEEAISTMQQLYREKKWVEIGNSCMTSVLLIMGTGKLFSSDQDTQFGAPGRRGPRDRSSDGRQDKIRKMLDEDGDEGNWYDSLRKVKTKAGLNTPIEALAIKYVDLAVPEVQVYKDPKGVLTTVSPGDTLENLTVVPNKFERRYFEVPPMTIEPPNVRPWRLARMAFYIGEFLMMLATFVLQHGHKYKWAAGALEGVILHNVLAAEAEPGYVFSRMGYLVAMYPTFVEMFYTQNATSHTDLSFDSWGRRNYSFIGLVEFQFRDTTDRFTEVPLIQQTWWWGVRPLLAAGTVPGLIYKIAEIRQVVRKIVVLNNIYVAEKNNPTRNSYPIMELAGFGNSHPNELTNEEKNYYDELRVAARLHAAYRAEGSIYAQNIEVAYPQLFRYPRYGLADPYSMFIQIFLPYIVMMLCVAYVSLQTKPVPPNVFPKNDPDYLNAQFNTTMNDNVRLMYNACTWIHDYVQNVTKEAGSAIGKSGLKITCNLEGIKEAIDNAKAANRMDELKQQRDALINALSGCTDPKHQEDGKQLLTETNKILNPTVLKSVIDTTSSAYMSTANTVKRVVRNDYTQVFFQCLVLGLISFTPTIYASIFGFTTNEAGLKYLIRGNVKLPIMFEREYQLIAGTLLSAGLEYTKADLGGKSLITLGGYFVLTLGILFLTFKGEDLDDTDSSFTVRMLTYRQYMSGLEELVTKKWGYAPVLTLDVMIHTRMFLHWIGENIRIYRLNSFEDANRGTFVRTKDYKHFDLKKIIKR